MEKIIAWKEGDGNIVISYTGKGNAPISFYSDTRNEGIDREQKVSVYTTDASLSADVIVRQPGIREVFNVADGGFVLSDGNTFNVKKQ